MSEHVCPECGTPAPARFAGETFAIAHGGLGVEVEGLAGWRCATCGEITLDADSAQRYAAAGDALVVQSRDITRTEIRRIRRKLRLTQRMAAELTGGGHNAFSRYERGVAVPMPAVLNLFKLLDRHPELLKELIAP